MGNAADKRESALSEMLGRLGHAKNADERYNNGFAHYSLAVHSSYARAFEKRMASFINKNNVTITAAVPVEAGDKVPPDLVGKTVIIDQPIFENTMTITRWIEYFYQESPAINARARDDQRAIGEQAFRQAAMPGFSPWGTEDKVPEPDD
jgi:hypothetical protein